MVKDLTELFKEMRSKFDLPFEVSLIDTGCDEPELANNYAHADYNKDGSTICLHDTNLYLDAVLAHEFGHLKAESEDKQIIKTDELSYKADTWYGEYWADRYAFLTGYGAELLQLHKHRIVDTLKILNELESQLDGRIINFIDDLFEYHPNFAAISDMVEADKKGTAFEIIGYFPESMLCTFKDYDRLFLNSETYETPNLFLSKFKEFNQMLLSAVY